MARKITPRERCTFCGKQPCECATTNRSKTIKLMDEVRERTEADPPDIDAALNEVRDGAG